MRIVAEWRDAFPKLGLRGGGGGVARRRGRRATAAVRRRRAPLCADLPERAFLRRGATWSYLGRSPMPRLQSDPTAFADPARARRRAPRELAPASSALHAALCGAAAPGGACAPRAEVVLDATLPCDGAECAVLTARVARVLDPTTGEAVFFEYVRAPCVALAFYEGGRQIATRWRAEGICADPRALAAAATCCSPGSSSAVAACEYSGERVTYARAVEKCGAAERATCDFASSGRTGCSTDNALHCWTSVGCRVLAQVDADGRVAVAHRVFNATGHHDAAHAAGHLALDSNNKFSVAWENGSFPVAAYACGRAPSGFATLGAYPGSTRTLPAFGGRATVREAARDGVVEVRATLRGLEPSVTGGLHVHAGVSCDDDDASVGGHFYGADGADPWTTGEATYTSDAAGDARVRLALRGFSLAGAENGVAGRAIVVHAKDGARVGCGLVELASAAAVRAGAAAAPSACAARAAARACATRPSTRRPRSPRLRRPPSCSRRSPSARRRPTRSTPAFTSRARPRRAPPSAA